MPSLLMRREFPVWFLHSGKEFASCHADEYNNDSSDDYEFDQPDVSLLINHDTRVVFAHSGGNCRFQTLKIHSPKSGLSDQSGYRCCCRSTLYWQMVST